MHPLQAETLYLDLAFMLIGLVFFMFMMAFCVKLINQDNERDYNRTLNERREFGYPDAPRKRRKKGKPPDLPKPQN